MSFSTIHMSYILAKNLFLACLQQTQKVRFLDHTLKTMYFFSCFKKQILWTYFRLLKVVVLRNWFFFYYPTPASISVFSDNLYVIFSHKILPFNFFQLVHDLFFSYPRRWTILWWSPMGSPFDLFLSYISP